MTQLRESYTQCMLVDSYNEHRFHVAWIPSKFAVVGKEITVKEESGITYRWVVTNIYSAKTAEETEKHERDYLRFHIGE